MTRSSSVFRFPAILLCIFVFMGVHAAAAQVVGTVTKVQKQAKVGATTAEIGTPVHMNQEVLTGPGARLQITFRDDTTLTLGENARLVVDRYVFDPGASTGVMALDASRGALRFATGQISQMRNKNVTVQTPVAAIAVRGTEFWAGIVDYQYGVLLLSRTGRVNVSNEAGAVTLSQTGQGTDIGPSLKGAIAPSDPYFWDPDKVARALAQTDFGFALGPELLLPAVILAPVILTFQDEPASP